MGKIIAITGAGFLTKHLLDYYLKTENIIRVVSRSQRSLEKLTEIFGKKKNLRLWAVDVRNGKELMMNFEGCDQVIHGAAEKRIDWCELNPTQSTDINVNGTETVCYVAHEKRVKKVLFISTDKAYNPQTQYGYTKALGEQLTIRYNHKSATTKYAAVRYGNVWGSAGSVIEKWDKLYREGKTLLLTNPDITRFFISPKDTVKLIVQSLREMKGGEVFIPELKAVRMIDIIQERYKDAKYKITSLRGEEKIHEELKEGYCSKDHIVSYSEMKEMME